MKSFLPFAVAVACIAPAFAADGWLSDLDEAKKAAAEQNKNILIEFTGSDWCPPCMALKKNVMSKEEFTGPASEQFVLLELDYPRQKEQSAEVKAKNQALAQKYGIEGFPTVVFADAKGVPFGSFVGGRDMNSVKKAMSDALKAKVDIDNAMAEAGKSEGEAKIKALGQVLKLAPKEYADTFYGDVKKELLELDKDDVSGLRAADALAKKLQEQEVALMNAMNGLGRDASPAEITKALDKFAETEGLLPETKQKIGYYRFQSLMGEGKLDEAIAVMDEAIKLSPESEPAQMMSSMKDFISKNKEQILKKIQEDKAARQGQPAEDKK